MNQDQTLQDILETVNFIKDNAVTKKEFRQELTVAKKEIYHEMGLQGSEFKKELEIAKHEIMNRMDAFIGLHQKLETELVALRSKCARLEGYIQLIAKHVKLDIKDLV